MGMLKIKKTLLFIIIIISVGCSSYEKDYELIENKNNKLEGYWLKINQTFLENPKYQTELIYDQYIIFLNNEMYICRINKDDLNCLKKNIVINKNIIKIENDDPFGYYFNNYLLSNNLVITFNYQENDYQNTYEKISKERFEFLVDGSLEDDTEE